MEKHTSVYTKTNTFSFLEDYIYYSAFSEVYIAAIKTLITNILYYDTSLFCLKKNCKVIIFKRHKNRAHEMS